MSTERPILMSAPMVRASLAGTKTQTRRPVKGFDECPHGYDGIITATVPSEAHLRGKHCLYLASGESVYLSSPYGAPGDQLWVRETFSPIYPQDKGYNGGKPIEFDYRATPTERMMDHLGARKWKPAIHMPRAACRLVLEVEAVRAERLLKLTVEDSFAEGIELMRCPDCHLAAYGLPGWGHEDLQKTPIEAYWHLWDQLNERRGYGRSKNPWVWVITFRRMQ